MKVMIVVTHLLGTGHLSRALTLAHAFRQQNHDVLLVSGGMPATQLDTSGVVMSALPPLRSDGTNFTRLLTEAGTEADAAFLAQRTSRLVAVVNEYQPDILLTELFPFGRRVLRDEFLAALEAAHALPRRPVTLCSIRDILAPPSKPQKAEQTDQIIARYYDTVLVHSDPRAIALDVSWPVSDNLAGKLRYTGFVAPAAAKAHSGREGQGDILVSAGGGPVGLPIFRTAIEAARLTPQRQWRLLIGGKDAEGRIETLRPMAGNAPVILEPARPDFRRMLHSAAASVSMCGYNTSLDLLQAGTPAVLVPFDDGGEVEQGLRAQSLQHLPAIQVLNSASLTPASLANAVTSVIDEGPRTELGLDFDGANRSVEIAVPLAEARLCA